MPTVKLLPQCPGFHPPQVVTRPCCRPRIGAPSAACHHQVLCKNCITTTKKCPA